MIVVSEQEIRKQIYEDWSQKPQSQICLAIFDYLLKNNHKSLSHITYGSLRKIAGVSNDDQNILMAIQYLCGDKTHLLEAKFELIDDEENYFDISNSELNKAHKTGQLLHPQTGELISNFKEKVFMYFQPSSLIKSLSNNNVN
jgi:hypothetical protein